MSKLYGCLENERGCKSTRCASKAIRAAAQSYDGSLIVEMFYDKDKLCVVIEAADCSADIGKTIFCGTFEGLKDVLKSNCS